MKKFCSVVASLLLSTGLLHAQAKATATRAGDLQVGGSFTSASSDYLPNRIYGAGFYANFDFTDHLGVALDFHQLGDHTGNTQVYERSYEAGVRYYREYRERFKPYARISYGRGVFNFPNSVANLAYNMFDIAGGVDTEVQKRINVRVEYEYQRWLSFPPNGLNPQLITIGVAYHFPAGRPR